MACGDCTDNKNLNNKIEDSKNFKLEDMKNLSIDDIIKLYRDGYRIESMQYSTYCTGSSSPDRSNTTTTVENIVNLDTAYAQRVKPGSKCLASITLLLANDSTYRNDMYVEIRHDSGGFPDGNPKSGGSIFNATISYSNISSHPTFGEIQVTVNKILSDSDITNGIWIILCSDFYDAYSSDNYPYHYTKSDAAGNSNEYMLVKQSTNPWQPTPPSTWNLYFKTNKQTYAVPCQTPVISITCPTSPINQGTTANITANITTAGTPNYTYKLYVDSNLVTTSSPTSATSYSFSHLFNESGGSHTYRVDVVDSCSTGAKTVSSNNCTLNVVVPCPTPVISVTCPTSPINQGSIGSIIATITTAGTPNYTYNLYVDSGANPVDTFGPTNLTSHTFVHTFSESGGSHNYRVDVVDSCTTPGARTGTSSCSTTISVTGCPTPVISVTCPTGPVNQGTTANITATITTAGTPNYTYKLYVDSGANPVDTFGPTSATSHPFSHLFSESSGSHTYRVDVVDSCSTGAKTATNNCTLNIQTSGGCPIPVISTTCQASIIQGLTGNIVATITTAGTPNYTYKLYRDLETIPIDTFGPTPNTTYTFSHLFNESIATHTFKVELTDSCTNGALTSVDICSTTITQSGGIPTAGMGSGIIILAVGAAAVLALALRKKSTR